MQRSVCCLSLVVVALEDRITWPATDTWWWDV